MRTFLTVVATALLASALPTHTHAQALSDLPAASQTLSVPLGPAAPVPVFSQTDTRWKWRRLGSRTLGTAGCLVSVIANGLVRGGIDTDPAQVLDTLMAHGLIDRAGNVRTRELDRALPLRFVNRLTGLGRDPASAIAEQLALGMVVMLELNHSASGGRGRHFVLVTRADHGDITVADPAGGHEASLLDLYGRFGVKSAIVYQRTE